MVDLLGTSFSLSSQRFRKILFLVGLTSAGVKQSVGFTPNDLRNSWSGYQTYPLSFAVLFVSDIFASLLFNRVRQIRTISLVFGIQSVKANACLMFLLYSVIFL